ncbi:MAG TPA: acyloxyacyl hydrolase [Syntrophales bacterium]|nr:acyloxyacyl hydrolase [Syntrophales bacterium]
MNGKSACRKSRIGLGSSLVPLVAIFALFLFLAETVRGDDGKTGGRFFTEVGVMAGYGSGNIPEGRYQPLLLIGHFGVDLKRYIPGLRSHAGTLSAFIEPQVNPVFEPSTDYEAGIGIGLRYSYPVCDPLALYVEGSTGPHYVSVVTRKQANGFLFSNVAGAGLYYRLSKDSALHAGYRFRHMSNGDLAEPNGGIDTHMGVAGYSLFFK